MLDLLRSLCYTATLKVRMMVYGNIGKWQVVSTKKAPLLEELSPAQYDRAIPSVLHSETPGNLDSTPFNAQSSICNSRLFRIGFLTFVSFLFLPGFGQIAYGAIAFDVASSSASVASPVSPRSISLNIGSINNPRLLICVQLFQISAGVGVVTGITVGGSPATHIATRNTAGIYGTMYQFTPTATGSTTISVAFSGSHNTFNASAINFTGVDSIEATSSLNAFSLNATSSITTITADAYMAGCMHHYETNATALSAGTATQNISANFATAGMYYRGPITTPALTTSNWTWSTNSRDWITTTVSLKPYVAATSSATTTVEISYHDWLFVNTWIIFFLSLNAAFTFVALFPKLKK